MAHTSRSESLSLTLGKVSSVKTEHVEVLLTDDDIVKLEFLRSNVCRPRLVFDPDCLMLFVA